MEESEHIQQYSSDEFEFMDNRGIKIADSDWTCPNCGETGMLMHRPGSKNTCATCFWVRNGSYNDYVFDDISVKYRHAQMLLASKGEKWSGTPGDVVTRLERLYDTDDEIRSSVNNIITGSFSADTVCSPQINTSNTTE